MDSRPGEQPQGTSPFRKNGVNDENGSTFNEPGFRKLATVVPYKLNGVIETDSKPILFSTDNINSAIGYFNAETELYEAIIDDNPSHLVNFPNDGRRMEFTLDHYITGQAQRNYKNQMVIVFTDKDKWPKYLNCDDPSISVIDDIRLFAYFKPPKIFSEQTIGGSLPSGAYYIAIGYERNDGTSTPYSRVSSVTTITPPTTGTTSDKALDIRITEADTSYDSLRVAIISKVLGVTKAVELNDFIPISSGIIEFTYSGDNLSTDISVESILVQPAIYNKVGTVGQLNDYLYLGDVEEEPDINDMQPYALMINIEWKSEIINALAPPPEHVAGKKKGMMHEETYAYYVRYKKTRGGFTKWYTIAGPAPITGDEVESTEATAGGYTGSDSPKYKVDDTIHYFNSLAKTGSCGVWLNDTELYPDTVDFDASTIGGVNLRGEKVRHHKMPTIRWCKNNLYPNDDNYGKTELDILGIVATNVRIPDRYIGVIDGYEIGYAKRTVGNMTVYGQSVLMHGVVNNFDKDKSTGNGATIYTSGGNWRTSIWHKGDGNFNNNYELVQLRKDTFRFHAFDLLFNKPSIEPTYISSQLRMKRNMPSNECYIEDGQENANKPEAFLVDYTIGERPVPATPTHYLRRIKNSIYLPNGINTNGFVNARHENTFAGTLLGTDWDLNYDDSGLRVKGQDYTEDNVGCPGFEETYLVNLIAIKANLYDNFFSQSMVSAGDSRPLTSIDPFWGGDTFVCDYTFHTYGRHETNDGWGAGIAGKKAIRRFVCESASNLALRYEIIGNIYSKWYPHNPVSINTNANTTYIIDFDRGQDPNQFGYDKSLNALNDLVSSVIFNPFREEIIIHPYRIHRGGKNTRTGRPRSWRTFLPLDYYEMQKNMGRLIHLEGMDDRLLIHMESALFYTQDKVKLEAGLLSVTLGAGDIFQFEPQEAISAKLGYAGTQHDLACVRTPIGYVFVDAKVGEIYIYKGKLENLNEGVNTFLREFLKIKEKNIYTGNGITIGWDQKYKRILLTVKNRTLVNSNTIIKDFQDTTEFWSSLVIGDIVRYNNRLIKYEGINPEDSEFQCPDNPDDPIYTWDKTDPICVEDGDGNNIGLQRWQNRVRRTNGILDGYTEANTPNGGIGPYFPDQPSDDCPPPAPVITWEPASAQCQEVETIGCEEGYTLSEDGTYCYKEETTAPTIDTSGICVAVSTLTGYGGNGMRIFATTSDYTNHLSGTFSTNNIALWAGSPAGSIAGTPPSFVNREGVWVDTNCDGTKDALASGKVLQFSINIVVAVAKTVYIVMAGDNTFRVDLNGTTVADCDGTNIAGGGINPTDNFTFSYAFPVNLIIGNNLFTFRGVGDGSVNDALAVAVFDNTFTQMQAAVVEGDLTYLFRTSDYIGTTIDIATCPTGWQLDTSGGSGSYVCRRTLTEAPIPSGFVNTGYIEYELRCRSINGYPDGFCEDNTPTGGEGIYIEPVFNNEICLTEAPPSGPIIITGTVTFNCADNNCIDTGYTYLSFTFTDPTPANLEIWVAERHTLFGGMELRGYEIVDPIPPGTSTNIYWQKAFLVTIPAGVTSYTTAAIIYAHIVNTVGDITTWRCNNCSTPTTDLYFKLDSPDGGIYELSFTSTVSGITIHIIP